MACAAAPRSPAGPPEALRSRGVADRVQLDLGLLRDLGYYTGAILEVYDPALGHVLGEAVARGGGVDQAPVDGGLAAEALGLGGEQVGAVLADVPLVDDAGETAGAGQHSEEWHLGQGDR